MSDHHAARKLENEYGYRIIVCKARMNALDLSKEADWTTLKTFRSSFSDENYLRATTRAAALAMLSTLPAATPPEIELREFPPGTTKHEIHEAFEAEVKALIGSDIHFLGTTIISLGQDKVDVLTMLRRHPGLSVSRRHSSRGPHGRSLGRGTGCDRRHHVEACQGLQRDQR